MSIDFSKFSYPDISTPHAASLTEAITVDAVPKGYVVVTIKAGRNNTLSLVPDFAGAGTDPRNLDRGCRQAGAQRRWRETVLCKKQNIGFAPMRSPGFPSASLQNGPDAANGRGATGRRRYV